MPIQRRQTDVPITSKIEAPAGALEGPVAPEGGEGSRESILAVRALGLLVYNTMNSFWMSDSDFESSVKDRFKTVSDALEKHQELRFTVNQSNLMINGVLAEMDNRYVKSLTEHLSKIEVASFALTRGLTGDEFMELVKLLGKSVAQVAQLGGFSTVVAAGGFKNVQAKKIVLREIAEDELVVAKEQVDEKAIERRKLAEMNVLTYLKDGKAEANEESVESLRDMSREPHRLAQVLIAASDSRKSAAAAEGREESKTVIVSLLERFFDGLMKHPGTRTRTGKRAVEKALEELKTELLKAIEAQPGDEVSTALEDAVKQMAEGLRIAGVAADYSRKLKALEQSEKRILRFIKAKGLEKMKQAEMEQELGEAGLDVEGWKKLLAKSMVVEESREDVEATATELEESHRAIENLAALLVRIEGDISGKAEEAGGGGAERLTSELKEASEKVGSLVQGTERKIQNLVQAVTSDIENVEAVEKTAAAAGQGPKMSRKQMLAVLAEIVQEICQPLAIISCSVGMVRSTKLGLVTPAQENMLKMADDGIERIRILADSLGKISGMPTTLSPDENIRSSLYVKGK